MKIASASDSTVPSFERTSARTVHPAAAVLLDHADYRHRLEQRDRVAVADVYLAGHCPYAVAHHHPTHRFVEQCRDEAAVHEAGPSLVLRDRREEGRHLAVGRLER